MTALPAKKIALLGSTGSIGRQTLEVIADHPDLLCAEILTAQDNLSLLTEQAIRFKPNAVVIGNDSLYPALKRALRNEDIKVFAGREALCEVLDFDSIDMALTAMVGIAGLEPTMAAIQAGLDIALANKETLVVAGHLVTSMAREKGVNIFPVDSEHSAIFQCLAGEYHNPIEKIILTASGGPFLGKDLSYLSGVTKAAALAHPNWDMGNKISIDSATLMNKGLEVIEAKWLFGLQVQQIEVVIHPQSIIHSVVQFEDGSMKAQMGLPDMKLPILYALTHPIRAKTTFPRFRFADHPLLTFEAPDTNTFPCLGLAYEALSRGGNAACIMNAANEVAVGAFLEEQIGFSDIPELVSRCMAQAPFLAEAGMDDIIQSNEAACRLTRDMLKHFIS